MYRVFSAKFKEGKAKPFREWVKKNRKKLDEAIPDSVKFLGGYFIVEGSAEHDYEDWWELDNWKAMDDLTKDEKFHQLEKELEEELGSVFEWWRIKFLESP